MSRDPKITSKIMSYVKSKNTKPELILRTALWHKGYRFRVNFKELVGKPDIVLTKAKIAIFCDGDFWHGNNWSIRGYGSLEEELLRYNDFWRNKIIRNINRDKEINASLKKQGWTVIRIWESDIKINLKACISIIDRKYRSNIKKLRN